MKKNFHIISCLILLIFIITSCGNYYYAPTDQSVLKFKKKGDLAVSGGINSNFTNWNAGYAPSKNIGFITTFNSMKSSTVDSLKPQFRNNTYVLDNEIVWFKELMPNVYSAFNFGYGFGSIERNSEYFKLKFNRQFLQPSIGYSNKFVDLGFSTRFVRVDYNLRSINGHDLSQGGTLREGLTLYDVGESDFYFIEPTFTFGLGYKVCKLRAQWVSSSKLSDNQISYINSDWNLSVNVFLSLDKFYK